LLLQEHTTSAANKVNYKKNIVAGVNLNYGKRNFLAKFVAAGFSLRIVDVFSES
jgi:hypothetical protein